MALLSLAHMKGQAFGLDHTAKASYLPQQMQDSSSPGTVWANTVCPQKGCWHIPVLSCAVLQRHVHAVHQVHVSQKNKKPCILTVGRCRPVPGYRQNETVDRHKPLREPLATSTAYATHQTRMQMNRAIFKLCAKNEIHAFFLPRGECKDS